MTPALFRLLETIAPATLRLVDVGACRGDFTAAVRAAFPGSTALLFEPGPAKSEALRARFASDRACASSRGPWATAPGMRR